MDLFPRERTAATIRDRVRLSTLSTIRLFTQMVIPGRQRENGQIKEFSGYPKIGWYPNFEYAQYLPPKKKASSPRLSPKHGAAYAALTNRLRQAREDAGLSQTEAARRLDKPQSFISKVESGQRRLDVLELKTLAGVYGKELSFFDVS